MLLVNLKQYKTTNSIILYRDTPDNIPTDLEVVYDGQNLARLIQRLISLTVGTKITGLFDEKNILDQKFEKVAPQVFNEIKVLQNTFHPLSVSLADFFFNQFISTWLDLIKRRLYEEAIELWLQVLSICFNWERTNVLLHKGTPYYFLGVTHILADKVEDGFLLMHQALEEDKRNLASLTPSTPAYYFTTLDFQKAHQFFRLKVEEISQYLFERIDEYKKGRKGKLTLSGFKISFLENKDLREEVFLLVYFLFRLKKMVTETDNRLKENEFSSILHAKILFDGCLVIEKTVEYKNPDSLIKDKLYFSDEIQFLRNYDYISITQAQINAINTDFNRDFGATLTDILNSNYTLPISEIDKDFMIAYRIRNFAAHEIEEQRILYEKMPQISQRLCNALFYIVERLYLLDELIQRISDGIHSLGHDIQQYDLKTRVRFERTGRGRRERRIVALVKNKNGITAHLPHNTAFKSQVSQIKLWPQALSFDTRGYSYLKGINNPDKLKTALDVIRIAYMSL